MRLQGSLSTLLEVRPARTHTMLVALVACCGIAATAVVEEAGAASCPSFQVGVDSFSAIQSSGATCAEARRLLDQTTLTKNRRARSSWTYGGWQWTFKRLGEMGATISGRQGARRITARWAKS